MTPRQCSATPDFLEKSFTGKQEMMRMRRQKNCDTDWQRSLSEPFVLLKTLFIEKMGSKSVAADPVP